MTKIAALPGRATIAISGEDRVAFLQGLVSNDVAEVVPGRAIWAAFLTPQGKWLADFFVLMDGEERLLLDCERQQAAMLVHRFSRYRLRSRVMVSEVDLPVYVAWENAPTCSGIVVADPRLPEAGWRVLTTDPVVTTAMASDWDLHRLSLGLPDGSRDMEAEKTILLEAGFDELHGVSWTKGCYLGQELTARTKYRGLVKRRLVPVRIDGPELPCGAPLLLGGREVGTMRSARGEIGMALVRLADIHSALLSGTTVVTPMVPRWMRSGLDAEGTTSRDIGKI
jgi:folate-binding protein YgfZ